MRQPLVIANWKMHGKRAFNQALVEAFLGLLEEHRAECVLCPPFAYLGQLAELLRSSDVMLGGQDCSHIAEGAYTGEVSAEMLDDCGCQWVIVGHSERRQYHQESDALVAAKLSMAQRAGLTPVLCVGETQEQRETGEAQDVVKAQLLGALGDLPDLQGLAIAYEPVWAIGTGLTASPEQAQDMHAFIRDVVTGLDATHASGLRLLYGGSVKAGNAAELFAQADIDGALVGGASLDAEAFAAIVCAA
ncbi:triose-phosphate isomerase [Congregibacter variabilis]|uniref:Triosephosphate isomerase n=1 Tax=Congregibacter variabilis TaxID=3081200 RepID=A0ABZ0HXC0_9GAMM|nr:triose-phosphate isomerase [Congregibacter sp. IMCC43200]